MSRPSSASTARLMPSPGTKPPGSPRSGRLPFGCNRSASNKSSSWARKSSTPSCSTPIAARAGFAAKTPSPDFSPPKARPEFWCAAPGREMRGGSRPRATDGFIARKKKPPLRRERLLDGSDPALPCYRSAQRNWLGSLEKKATGKRPLVPIDDRPYLTAGGLHRSCRLAHRCGP